MGVEVVVVGDLISDPAKWVLLEVVEVVLTSGSETVTEVTVVVAFVGVGTVDSSTSSLFFSPFLLFCFLGGGNLTLGTIPPLSPTPFACPLRLMPILLLAALTGFMMISSSEKDSLLAVTGTTAVTLWVEMMGEVVGGSGDFSGSAGEGEDSVAFLVEMVEGDLRLTMGLGVVGVVGVD